MFGADTNLVFDAIQMVAVAAAFTGGAVYLMMRRKRSGTGAGTGAGTGTGTGTGAGASTADANAHKSEPNDLEARVRVLERIATDPATRLAEEFEQLERADKTGKEHA